MPGNADLRIGLSNHADAESPRYQSCATWKSTSGGELMKWVLHHIC